MQKSKYAVYVLEVAGLEKCFILYSTIHKCMHNNSGPGNELHQNEAGSQMSNCII